MSTPRITTLAEIHGKYFMLNPSERSDWYGKGLRKLINTIQGWGFKHKIYIK